MASDGPQGALWRFRKTSTAAVLSALLPRPVSVDIPLSRPLRVGYLRFDRRVGEVLLQTPIFQAHKRARPGDTVIAIVHPKMVRLLKDQPFLDEIVPFSWRGFPVLEEAWDARDRLVNLKLDVAVDCSDPSLFSVGHALATRMTGAPIRVGFKRGPADAHFTHPIDVPSPLHEASARAGLLGAFGIDAPPSLHFVPHPAARTVVDGVDVVEKMLAEPGKHALVCPGGRLAWRRGTPAQFAAMCRVLVEKGRTPWVAPGPGEEPMCQQILDAAKGSRMLPQTDLDQLGALMQAAGVTVCNNSGPMHLSVAVGARTFALFIKMDPTRWGHHDARHKMVSYALDDTDAEAMLVRTLREWL